LWSEARKTLEATRIAQDERRFAVTLTRYERVLALPDSIVRSTRSFTQAGVSENPFVSLHPDSIAQTGYRGKVASRDVYLGPDARGIMSDQFVAGHCFGTRRDGPAGTVGLAFRPSRNAGQVEVEGVLWLDSASAELRSMEYRYTPAIARTSAGGGTVEFGRLPSGVWGVRRWAIRVPVFEVRESSRRPDGALGRFVDTVVTSIQEEGGEVLTGVGGGATSAATRVRGVVFDSTRGIMLAAAVVTLEGAGRTVRSDAAGRFLIDSLTEVGAFQLRFWHPRLDSLGIGMPRAPLRVRRGEEAPAYLAIPGAASIARERCGVAPAAPTRVVAGVVRRAGDRTPIGGGEVIVLERMPETSVGDSSRPDGALRRHSTSASESGRYAFCLLSTRSTAWLIARSGGRWSQPLALTDSATTIALDVEVPLSDARAVDTSARARPIVELRRAPLAGDDASVEGWVLFSDEPPSAPVQVVVDGRVLTTVLPVGHFQVERIAEGSRQLTLRAPGLTPASANLSVRRGESMMLLVTLERPVAAMATVVVPGRSTEASWVRGFEERRRRGQGVFFDRETLNRAAAQTLADVLRGVPGIRLVALGGGYRYQSTHRQLSFDSGPGCEMVIYLDGQPLLVEPGTLDQHVRASEIAAVEVYTSATTVPRQFAGKNSGCGVIVLWRGS